MWEIELEPEVAVWMEDLSPTDFAIVLAHVERLGERGNLLRMPVSRSLGGGLFELRFDLGRTARRIAYYFGNRRTIVLLTTFRKQRSNERHEVARARRSMERCIAEGHLEGKDRT